MTLTRDQVESLVRSLVEREKISQKVFNRTWRDIVSAINAGVVGAEIVNRLSTSPHAPARLTAAAVIGELPRTDEARVILKRLESDSNEAVQESAIAAKRVLERREAQVP
ncbi:MAG: hypothetical protein AAFN79_01440 [Pseudomonadota bacterium]